MLTCTPLHSLAPPVLAASKMHAPGLPNSSTPADVHFRRAEDVLQKRQAVLQAAYKKTLERFVKGVPHPIQLPKAVWINRPTSRTTAFIEHPTRMVVEQSRDNENENSHCKSTVPVSFGGEMILPEFRLQIDSHFTWPHFSRQVNNCFHNRIDTRGFSVTFYLF